MSEVAELPEDDEDHTGSDELMKGLDQINDAVNSRWRMSFEPKIEGLNAETYMVLQNDATGEHHRALLSGNLRTCIIRYRGNGWRVYTNARSGIRTIVARTGKSKEYQTLARKVLGLPPQSELDGKDLVFLHKNGDDMDYRHGNIEVLPQSVHQIRWKLLKHEGPRLYENYRSKNCIQQTAEVYFEKVRYGIKGNKLIPGMTEFLEKVYQRFIDAVTDTSDPKEIHRRLGTIIANARVNRPRPAPPVEEILFETNKESSMEETKLVFNQVGKTRAGISNYMAVDGDVTWLSVRRNGQEVTRVRIDTALAAKISKTTWYDVSNCTSLVASYPGKGRVSLLSFIADEAGISNPRKGYDAFFANADFSDYRVSNIVYLDFGIRTIRIYLVTDPERVHERDVKTTDSNGAEVVRKAWYAGVALHRRSFVVSQFDAKGVKERVTAFMKECCDAIFSHIHADECLVALEEIHRRYVRAIERSEERSAPVNEGLSSSVLVQSIAVEPSECSASSQQELDLGAGFAASSSAVTEEVKPVQSIKEKIAAICSDEADWTDDDERELSRLINKRQLHLERQLSRRFDHIRSELGIK